MGAAAVGSTISVYAVARLMMNLPAGVLADRYGRKPLLVWGPAVTALGAAPSQTRRSASGDIPGIEMLHVRMAGTSADMLLQVCNARCIGQSSLTLASMHSIAS